MASELMHAGSHYKLRRLASTHTLDDPSEQTEEVDQENHEDHDATEPIHESLICRVFMVRYEFHGYPIFLSANAY